jgi:hypothetical protein
MVNLVLITSVICTSDNPLSYIRTRSIYTHNDRFEQTKKTIETVKHKIPDLILFIVECSDLNSEQENYLKKNSDYFLNLYENHDIRNNVSSISKSLGEGTMTLCALKYIINNNINFDNLIKISGRYWLSDNFDYIKFNNNYIVIKYIENNVENAFTALYKLPKEKVNNYITFLEKHFTQMIKCVGFEILFSIFLKSEKGIIINLNPIGLEGYVSVSNDFYSG